MFLVLALSLFGADFEKPPGCREDEGWAPCVVRLKREKDCLMASERDRLDYIIERDGEDAAVKFAEQGLYVYTMDSIKKSPYGDSLKVYREFLEARGYEIQIVVVKKK